MHGNGSVHGKRGAYVAKGGHVCVTRSIYVTFALALEGDNLDLAHETKQNKHQAVIMGISSPSSQING